MTDDAKLRDEMAVERTRLANERTLLAYVRTALALLAGAAAIFHFFAGESGWISLAWLLLFGGAGTGIIGAYRFVKVRRSLTKGHA